jgi:hypothetical protein
VDNSVKKMINEKLTLKKFLICALLTAIASSVMATSVASAREIAPSQMPTDTNSAPEDNPILISTLDNSTVGSNDTPLLDRAQDANVTTPSNDASLISTQDVQTEDNPPLIAPLTQPDNNATILGVAALVTAIGVAAIVVVLKLRKKI